MPYSYYDVTYELFNAMDNDRDLSNDDPLCSDAASEWMGSEGEPIITIPKERWMDMLHGDDASYVEFLNLIARLDARVIMGAHWVSDANFVIIQFPDDTSQADMTWMKLRFG